MTCERCGDQNRHDARFCASCGAALVRTCTACRRELAADARFCDGCGVPVTTAEARPTEPGPTEASTAPLDDAVRKVVTVLFCDVVGSTAFAEGVDAETARETLAEYHAVSKEAIESHGGTVAKFIGDGVMATFGLPEVATDDAERAVLAGLELQRRFAAIRDRVAERYGADLGLRVGVNTGEVATGAGDADLVGDVLNTAARLEAAAPRGGVLVGEATWRLTRSTVDYAPGGEVEARGKAEPLATFLANGVLAPAAEAATPFVGRDDELAVLADALGQAREAGTAVVVTAIGAPGVGKTRLAAEFVDRHGGEVVAYDLRCEQAGATTFAPIADLVRAAAGLSVSQPDDEQRAGIAQLLGPSLPEAPRLVDLLASFVGAAPAPSTEEAFYAVRRLCEQLAADRPLVLVIDDIQWAEPRLLDLIEHLGKWVGAPVVIVNLARPEIREVRPALAEAGRRVRAVVTVGGLDAAATRRLAAELLGAALPSELTDRLGTSTDGNPLFVRELVRMLVDDGILVRAEDGWDLTVDLEAVEVPPTIQSLLATRVERLPPDERRLIELAAVVGPEFALGAVADLAGLPTAAVAATLERLRRKDVIESTGTYRGDEPVLRFHHILIRDAAYRRLLKKTRALLHQRAGEWTERTSVSLTGDHEAAIAHHLEQAYRYRLELGLDDADTAALGRRAAALLQVAAAGSLARDDLPAAGAFAVRALALLPVDATGRDELLLLACEALLGVGDVAGAIEPLTELAASGDERTTAWADCFAGEVVALSDPERLAEAEVSVGAAAERLARLGDPAGVAKARQVRALLLVRLARVADGEAELDRSLAAAREADDRRRISAVLGAAPQAALWGPSPVPQAGGRCLDVVRLVRITNGSPAVEATSWRCQGVLEALRSRFDTAERLIADARRVCEELGLHQDLLVTELYAGIIALLAGDPSGAEPHLRLAADGLARLGIGADLGQATAHLARSLLLQGRVEEAGDLATRAAALAGQNPQSVVVARCVQADVLLAQGRTEAAVASARAAVERLAGSDVVIDLANAHAAVARACAAAGDVEAARGAAVEADRLYRLKGATALVGLAGGALAGRSAPPSPPEPAAAGRLRDNAASRSYTRFIAATGTTPRSYAGLAPSIQVWDRRVVAMAHYDGLAEFRSSLAPDVLAERLVRGATRAVAVRGERWSLHHDVLETESGLDVPFLDVVEVDADGVIVRLAFYDVERLGDAEACLNEWWLEEEPDATRSAWRRVEALGAAYDAGDLAAMTECTTPDLQFRDHRSLVGLGDLDQPGLIATAEERRAPGQTTAALDVAHLDASGAVLLGVSRQEVDGVEVEFHSWWVFASGADGRVGHVEVFEATERSAALARFDELRGRTGTGAIRRNLATRTANTLAAALTAGDFDGVMAISADEVLRVDQRSPLTNSPDARWAEVIGSMVGEGRPVWTLTHIAVRDQHWCVSRATLDFDGLVVEFLNALGVDDSGRVTRTGICNVDDLAGIEALLNEWWLATLPPGPRDVFECLAAARDAQDHLDTDGLVALTTEDFELVDHRQLIGAGRVDQTTMVDLVPGRNVPGQTTMIADVPRLNSRGALFLAVTHQEVGGVAAEFPAWWVVEVVDGRARRVEMVDVAEEQAALARFDELTGGDDLPVRVNAAARSVDAFIAAMNADDVEAAAALGTADAVVTDHRRIVSGSPAEAWATVARSLAADPGSVRVWRSTTVAVRDDRWCLNRARVDIDGMTIDWLSVNEVDHTQRYTRSATVDLDDLARAEALLDEWWGSGLDAPRRAVLEAVRRFRLGSAARDKAAPARAPVVADHRRRADRGALDVDRPADAGGPTLAPGSSLIADVERLTGAGLVATIVRAGPEGVATDDRMQALLLVADGEVQRVELFDAETDADGAAALARFDELTEPTDGDLANAATRVVDRLVTAARAEDDAVAVALFADEVVHVDVRPSSPVGGDRVAAYRSALEVAHSVGATREAVTLAIRGDRWCLHRLEAGADGSTREWVQVTGLDAAGFVSHVGSFAAADLEAAQAQLDEWWLVEHEAAVRETYALVMRATHALNHRDTAVTDALIAEDVAYADHRRLIGADQSARDDLLENTRTSMTTSSLITDVRRLDDRGVAVRSTARYEESGLEAEGDQTWTVIVRDGRIHHVELFDGTDIAAAAARFDELTTPT